MNRLRRLVIGALIALALSALAPKRADAFDTTPLIISGATAGVVIVIGLIAILVVGSEDDEELSALTTTAREPRDQGQVRFAHNCPLVADHRPLVCW